MDLTTRCPKCGTVFQATLSDLQLRKGYIRCVQCAHIFDGYAEVVSDLSGGASSRPSADVAPQPAMPSPVVAASETPQVIRSGRAGAARPEPSTAFHMSVAPWPDDKPEPRIGGSAGQPGPRPVEDILADEGWVPDAGSVQTSERHEPPAQAESFLVEARPGHRSQGGSAAPLLQDEHASGGWGALGRFCSWVLLVLLLLLAAGQAVYIYRARIAQAVPAVRPALQHACELLKCSVPYARDLAQLAITGSALKAAESDGSSRPPASGQPASDQQFVLHATLRNLAEYPQEWPTLVLDLKDAGGTLLVRRNLSPAEYLGPTRAAEPLGAREEILLRVPLTVAGVRVNGYQLDFFYP